MQIAQRLPGLQGAGRCLRRCCATGTASACLPASVPQHHPLVPQPACPTASVARAQCKGFGSKCIVDLNSAPNPLFLIGTSALLSGALRCARPGAAPAGGAVCGLSRAPPSPASKPALPPAACRLAPCAVNNVRVINGATMGNGAAGQITGPVRGVTFDACDFMGHLATNGGACAWRPGPLGRPAGGGGARRSHTAASASWARALWPLTPHACPPNGAVDIKGASNVRFLNCQLGVNFADEMGGAGVLVVSRRVPPPVGVSSPAAARSVGAWLLRPPCPPRALKSACRRRPRIPLPLPQSRLLAPT